MSAAANHKRLGRNIANARKAAGMTQEQLADAADTDDGQGLVGQLHALPLGALPTTLHQGVVGLGDVSGLGQQQRHGLLGCGQDVRLRGVDDHHATDGGVGHVDVVEPDPGPAYHHEVGAGLEHLGGDGGGRPDDEGVGPLHRLQQRFGGEVELHVDLVASGAQDVETSFGDLLRNQHTSHGCESGN